MRCCDDFGNSDFCFLYLSCVGYFGDVGFGGVFGYEQECCDKVLRW